MTTIREMFLHELTRLLVDYERCGDERIKREIYIDIELLRKVIFEETTKENEISEEELTANLSTDKTEHVNKITE